MKNRVQISLGSFIINKAVHIIVKPEICTPKSIRYYEIF